MNAENQNRESEGKSLLQVHRNLQGVVLGLYYTIRRPAHVTNVLSLMEIYRFSKSLAMMAFISPSVRSS